MTVLAACGAGSSRFPTGSPLAATGATPPLSGASPAASDRNFARLQDEAHAALDRWAAAVAAKGDSGFVPTGELTGQIGDWEFAVGDNNKSALMSGLVEAATPLMSAPPPDGEIRWQNGASAKVHLISPSQALSDIRSTVTGVCGGCQDLKVLWITDARLITGTIETSRGKATVPMWAFAIQGTAVRATRVAVANMITVVPPAWNPNSAPVGLSIESAVGTVAGLELTVHFVGAPGRGTEPCGSDYTAAGVESATAVVVIVYEHRHTGDDGLGLTCTDVGADRTARVLLAAPLGGRAVLEVREGLPIPITLAP
jgi:hypothetical protein